MPPWFLVLLPSLLHFLVSQILLPTLPFGTPCLLHAHSDSLNLNPFFFASVVLQDICCFGFWLHSLGLWLHSLRLIFLLRRFLLASAIPACNDFFFDFRCHLNCFYRGFRF
jgi:hypothetical protein